MQREECKIDTGLPGHEGFSHQDSLLNEMLARSSEVVPLKMREILPL